MSPGKYFYGGFGPVVPEGYGVNYAIDKDSLKFSISAKKQTKITCFDFRTRLEQTLIDMLILFPKRSEVWGMGWKKRFAEEAIEDEKIAKMKVLSDATMKKQENLVRKHR